MYHLLFPKHFLCNCFFTLRTDQYHMDLGWANGKCIPLRIDMALSSISGRQLRYSFWLCCAFLCSNRYSEFILYFLWNDDFHMCVVSWASPLGASSSQPNLAVAFRSIYHSLKHIFSISSIVARSGKIKYLPWLMQQPLYISALLSLSFSLDV